MIKEPPTFPGQFEQAWRLPVDGTITLAAYLVHAPRAHLAWAWHSVSLISLADFPDVKPAVRYFPAARYEITCLALDGEISSLDDTFHFLTPADAIVQFNGTDDNGARALLNHLAERIAAGVLVPDSDFRQLWLHTIAERLPAGATTAEPPYRSPIPRRSTAS